jgi:CARDB/Bacterial Ig domain
MKKITLLKSAVLGITSLAGLVAMTNAHAVPVTWNGWSFDYFVGANEGLELKNVKYQNHGMLKKISLPLIRVRADDASGCSVDYKLSAPYDSAPFVATPSSVYQRQITFNGKQWYEIGVIKSMTIMPIPLVPRLQTYYQAYYLSADGLFDAHLFSRGVEGCSESNIFTAFPFWRIDVDVEGAANDTIEYFNGTAYTPYNNGIEFGAPRYRSGGREWRVRDSLTNTHVNFGLGYTFPHPNDSGVLSFIDWKVDAIHGRLYRASEDAGWLTTSVAVPYGNQEPIANTDNVVWWQSTYKTSGSASVYYPWYAAGVSLTPSWTNPSPDLVISSVDFQDGLFMVKVKNQGTAVTPLLTANRTIGVGLYVDGIYKTWVATPALAPGEESDLLFSSSTVVSDGNHTISAYVDDRNRIVESNETNNQLSKSMVLGGGTDSTLPFVSLNSPSDNAVVSGSTVVLSANAYDNAAIKDVVFLLKNKNSDPGYGSPISTPKRNPPYVFSWDSTSVTPGDYFITARATDISGNISYASAGVQVIVPASIKKPDLVVTAVSYANGQFSSIVKNAGTADIPAQALMTLGYSVDGVYKTWTSSFGPLAAGASVNLGTKGSAYVIPSGSHVIKAHIDDQNLVMEANETNNQLSKTITVP